MNKQIQSEVLAFNELNFHIEPNIKTLILRIIWFATIVIVEFDPTIAKVGNVVVG